MKIISTDTAPKPGGHYSQAVVHDSVVYVAGQLPVDPKTSEKILTTIEAQTERVLKNIEAILIAAGSSKNHVLKTTVFITDIDHWSKVNKVYEEFFGSHKPARAVVPVVTLHYGFLVEIDAVAAVGSKELNR